jgi:hypothetical protein
MNQDVIDDLKKINWEVVLKFSNTLSDLNAAQWRFAKGTAIELCIEKHSNGMLTYVSTKHKDFDWTSRNLTVELKSQMSAKTYDKNGNLQEFFEFKLFNSNGTNKVTTITNDLVCDIVILPRSNGVIAVDRDTVIKNAILNGDGCVVRLPKSEVVEITKMVEPEKNASVSGLKDILLNAIKNAIP